ncbi:MAG TPA: hypothetical protein VLM85_16740 [Polyangiaceae bacterium]|nr:hypothetical protein [Polyangiaceae bacterium]
MRRLLVSTLVVTATALALAAAPGCSLSGNCNLQLVDCEGKGICTSLATDVYNCGACGHRCPTGAVCADGTCTTARGTPIITSLGIPSAVDPNPDGTHTLHATVWFTDDAAVVDSYDFSSSKVTIDHGPLPSPASTGSAAITINLPATTPAGTFDFTLDVAAGTVKSAPFSDSVVLR